MNCVPGSTGGAVPFTAHSFPFPRDYFNFWDFWALGLSLLLDASPSHTPVPIALDPAGLSRNHQGKSQGTLGYTACLAVYKPKHDLQGGGSPHQNNVCFTREFPMLYSSSPRDVPDTGGGSTSRYCPHRSKLGQRVPPERQPALPLG